MLAEAVDCELVVEPWVTDSIGSPTQDWCSYDIVMEAPEGKCIRDDVEISVAD